MRNLSSLLARRKRPLPDARRVAIAGLGACAHAIHLPALAQLDRVRIVAGCDPSETARARFASAYSLPTYADAPTMLERERPDWVVIATPPATHARVALDALNFGAHVFCEKPLVERASDAPPLLQAALAQRRQVVVNHEFPRMPIFSCVDALTRTDALGELVFLQLWEHQLETVHPGEWRAQCLTMREFGTHAVDLAVQLYRVFPERVYARMSSPGGPAGSDLVDVVTLDFPGSRLASIVLDRASHGVHRYLEMRADGLKGSLRASFGGRARVELGVDPRTRRPRALLDLARGGQAWLEHGSRRKVVARNSGNPFADATALHLASAIEATERDREPPVSAAYALEIVRLVEAAYSSAQSGVPVEFTTTASWCATCPP